MRTAGPHGGGSGAGRARNEERCGRRQHSAGRGVASRRGLHALARLGLVRVRLALRTHCVVPPPCGKCAGNQRSPTSISRLSCQLRLAPYVVGSGDKWTEWFAVTHGSPGVTWSETVRGDATDVATHSHGSMRARYHDATVVWLGIALLALCGAAVMAGSRTDWWAKVVARAGSTAAQPRATSTVADAQVPPRIPTPPDPAATGRFWFASSGPSGGTGGTGGTGDAGDAPGLWRHAEPDGEWAWLPLTSSMVGERIYAGTGLPPAPPWPDEPAEFRVERVRNARQEVLGYWVWNAAYFVRLPWGSHQWSPRWQWAPDGQPLLLVPAIFPVQLREDGPTV